ncbi:MAG TPA: hypothetical protein VHX88_11630 [Solirubrobacteraceae bacterium]|jgi:triacylglycerol esterase/lipase EstA (alpha/beta hydrolase family)|nr:hypothetical protein [Solirubrobacteraceae bacterium]
MARRGFASIVIAVAIALLGTGTAQAASYAPVNQPGPALDVPAATLAAALACPTAPATARSDVVLMIPGTTTDPGQAFSWNYEVAFKALGIPYCTITVPDHTDGDIQVAGEYVVNAVRTIHAQSGRPVVLFGWSQGASTLPRWALRFWPDIRPMVASLVGLAPLNNIGTVDANALCDTGECVPAIWQQRVGSQLLGAVNSGQQTFPGIAYTVIYTRADDVVAPDLTGDLSVLPAGPNVTNVAIQDLCPLDTSDHLLLVADPAAYAVAIEAIEHPGQPANLALVGTPSSCLPGTMPYVTPTALASGELGIDAPLVSELTTGEVAQEPPLDCYVFAVCAATPTAPVPTSTPATAPACTSRVTVRVPRGVRDGRVTLDGRPVELRRGAARLDLRGLRGVAVVRISGRGARGRRVGQTRRYHPCA